MAEESVILEDNSSNQVQVRTYALYKLSIMCIKIFGCVGVLSILTG